MSKNKILNVFILFTLIFSLFMSGNSQVQAQTVNPPDGIVRPEKQEKITQEDRQAAADRASEGGFSLEASVTMDAPMSMDMDGDVPRYFSHPNYANSPLPGNIVSDWNAIAQDVLQPPMAGMSMGDISMATAFVYLSYTQAAVYNALIAIEGGYYAYDGNPTFVTFIPMLVGGGTDAAVGGEISTTNFITDSTAAREAAVATAAYKVLIHYLPGNMVLPVKYAESLATIPDGPEKTLGISIGDQAAAEIIALRENDGLLAPDTYTPPAPGPGVWEPTMLLMDGVTFAPPVDPWMAQLKPFLRDTPDQYRPVPPPALDSPEYAADLNEVKEIGSAGSLTRTPEQTEVAKFWTDNMVIQTNKSYRNIAETRSLNLLDTARLMVMGNMVATDSLIATFDSKYFYNFWRPVTAIQRADTDGNAATDADPTWMPAVMTPNFPEYVAGHGSFVSAQAEMLTQFFGTDQIELDLESSVTGTTRHFSTAEELRTEIVNARTWGGLHFRNSSELAVSLGQEIVQNAFAHYLRDNPFNDTGEHAEVSGGIRKFVDELSMFCDPSTGPCIGTSTLGQFMPIGVPDTTTYPGSDYYEIALVQYREQMHSDLPATYLRGYVQLSTSVVDALVVDEPVQLTNVLLDGTEVTLTDFFGVTPPHYLGPTIIATKNKPVRIKFYNLLPTGIEGDLFLPVDTTVMGAGMGPDLVMPELTPEEEVEEYLNPMCGMAYDGAGDRIAKNVDCFAENRATLHLHGGITPWISDGTPHQWITPANELTSYPQGVSVQPVPDMFDTGDPVDGVMTFYYTNQQSARLMFYHDHAWGITRLNVYAGEVAPYLISDETEQSLIEGGFIPGPESTIPLVVQDKTFVPGAKQLSVSDETWDVERWGGPGNLWLPHVYSPAQNPGDASGVNQFGRWAYGPWFWPPTSDIDSPPVPNPYYDEDCDPDEQWCEPPMMPGVPYNSMGMEAFMDTPVLNGTVYPTLTVDPKSYRFRILNGANDRFFNLSFYQAVDANGVVCDAANLAPAPESTGIICTEVALADVEAALEDPTIMPTPVSGSEGPDWVQIGTEGGFLPAPTVLPAQPTTWVNDPTVFNAGNVDLHSLLIAPAERADVIVDFSAYAGQTLILYNDGPAAFPARDPRYDYFTGNGDYRDTGGASSTLPGYGPNTRTMMKIVVAPATPAPAFNLTALETAFKAVSLGGLGVFEEGQHPIIVGQGAYNTAYGTSFPHNGLMNGTVQIYDTSLTFRTLLGTSLTIEFKPKMIQDEMGEAFDPEYGRMSGFLGVETPDAQAGNQNMILNGYVMPQTEVLRGIELPPGVELTPISTADDGTQIWKFTHNGVDTHPIHFHLFDVQLLNRVGWDGIIRKPDANELGWKDTVRISPLEDTIVALRPLIPQIPWDLPNSVRLLDPSMPEGATLDQGRIGMFDPLGNSVTVTNRFVNFGWEYVFHCHILSHEEMDMMRPMSVGVRPRTPTNLAGILTGSGVTQTVVLTWQDNSLNETSFSVQRSLAGADVWSTIDVVPADTETYNDLIGDTIERFDYRVFASNVIGDTFDYADPAVGFPNTSMDSGFSNTIVIDTVAPGDPTDLVGELQAGPQISLTWLDNANTETGFEIERNVDGLGFEPLITLAADTISYIDTDIVSGSAYVYRVASENSAGLSAWAVSNLIETVPPAAPTDLTATLEAGPQVVLNWTDASINETGYVIERDDGLTGYVLLTTLAANNNTFTDITVLPGSLYMYRIAAENNAGLSEWVEFTLNPIEIPIP
ncbi:MAG: multicopper oxidase domain-containing protein [Anaerolineaceae bacterium]|nr:multicopper oxidase domain-containing protein [Anaerolineaceae bacterium]